MFIYATFKKNIIKTGWDNKEIMIGIMTMLSLTIISQLIALVFGYTPISAYILISILLLFGWAIYLVQKQWDADSIKTYNSAYRWTTYGRLRESIDSLSSRNNSNARDSMNEKYLQSNSAFLKTIISGILSTVILLLFIWNMEPTLTTSPLKDSRIYYNSSNSTYGFAIREKHGICKAFYFKELHTIPEAENIIEKKLNK
jgi:hypothetical protein